MKITYDSEAKAAYIYLTNKEPSFKVIDHTQEITSEVNLDWMGNGELYGIEILCVEEQPFIELL